MNKIACANWKANGSRSDLKKFFDGVASKAGVDVVICPPFHLLANATVKSKVGIGAQDCSSRETGAYTGEIPASLLAEAGVATLILGHSERRTLFGDDDKNLVQKLQHAHRAGLRIIFCVGETGEQRQAGRTSAVIQNQLSVLQTNTGSSGKLVIAYEPVWAIGSGKAATADEAHAVHVLLADWLKTHMPAALQGGIPILYGGSVNGDNARDLAAHPLVGGFLVGGASLKPETFNPIIAAL